MATSRRPSRLFLGSMTWPPLRSRSYWAKAGLRRRKESDGAHHRVEIFFDRYQGQLFPLDINSSLPCVQSTSYWETDVSLYWTCAAGGALSCMAGGSISHPVDQGSGNRYLRGRDLQCQNTTALWRRWVRCDET